MTDSFSYILGAYGVALIVLSGLAVFSFVQRRRLRRKEARVSDR